MVPYIEETAQLFGWDDHAQDLLFQEFEAWFLWYVPAIFPSPAPDAFFMWQPWLKNFYGFDTLGRRGHYAPFQYSWIDEDLKAEMTGQ